MGFQVLPVDGRRSLQGSEKIKRLKPEARQTDTRHDYNLNWKALGGKSHLMRFHADHQVYQLYARACQ
jgi:hypothetical protein